MSDKIVRHGVWRAPTAMALSLLALAACQNSLIPQPTSTASSGPRLETVPQRPSQSDDSRCWTSKGTPAMIEMVEEEVVIEPAGLSADGTLREEPLTRIETRERIVSPNSEVWFETLCDAEWSDARVQTLQRALQVRGFFSGEINGTLDTTTMEAIRAYQSPLGLNSGTLARESAERLGVVPLRASD